MQYREIIPSPDPQQQSDQRQQSQQLHLSGAISIQYLSYKLGLNMSMSRTNQIVKSTDKIIRAAQKH